MADRARKDTGIDRKIDFSSFPRNQASSPDPGTTSGSSGESGTHLSEDLGRLIQQSLSHVLAPIVSRLTIIEERLGVDDADVSMSGDRRSRSVDPPGIRGSPPRSRQRVGEDLLGR